MLSFKYVCIAAAIAAFALTASDAFAATRIEPSRPQRGAPQRSCTIDRTWCVARTGDSVTVLHNENRNYRDVARLQLPSNERDRIESQLWPSIIRITSLGQPEFALIGVERTQREMFSGGGASVTQLTLFEIRTGAPSQPRPVLEAPWAGGAMIRACFSREDERRRRGACHDQYDYSATLFAPPAQQTSGVSLIYRSRATSFPGGRSRQQDSGRDAPLRKSDLVHAVDRRCSVERTLTRNPASGAFAWSAPLPRCSDYLELQ